MPEILRIDPAHKRRIRQMTCIILGCRMIAEQHHVRRPCLGIGRRDDAFSFPLCHRHHRSGGYGVAIHYGRKSWEKQHRRTEVYFLRLVYKMLDVEMPERVRVWVEERMAGDRND